MTCKIQPLSVCQMNLSALTPCCCRKSGRKTGLHLLKEESAVVPRLHDQVVQLAEVSLVQRPMLGPCVEYVLHSQSTFTPYDDREAWHSWSAQPCIQSVSTAALVFQHCAVPESQLLTVSTLSVSLFSPSRFFLSLSSSSKISAGTKFASSSVSSFASSCKRSQSLSSMSLFVSQQRPRSESRRVI